jgi:hypothetical protein
MSKMAAFSPAVRTVSLTGMGSTSPVEALRSAIPYPGLLEPLTVEKDPPMTTLEWSGETSIA